MACRYSPRSWQRELNSVKRNAEGGGRIRKELTLSSLTNWGPECAADCNGTARIMSAQSPNNSSVIFCRFWLQPKVKVATTQTQEDQTPQARLPALKTKARIRQIANLFGKFGRVTAKVLRPGRQGRSQSPTPPSSQNRRAKMSGAAQASRQRPADGLHRMPGQINEYVNAVLMNFAAASSSVMPTSECQRDRFPLEPGCQHTSSSNVG